MGIEELRGQVAVVTGASRGIGRAIAVDLANAGMRVVGTARPSEALEDLARALDSAESPGFVVPADLTDQASVEALFAAVDAHAGRIDVLVNNAGIARVEPFMETSVETWRAIMATNVDAGFLMSQAAARRMLRRGSGHIVFIASDAAVRGIPRMAPYCTSKHAVLGLARALALELREPGIRVTTILPGPVNTTILSDEANRFDLPQPEDIAATVRYALSLPPRAQVCELLITPTRV